VLQRRIAPKPASVFKSIFREELAIIVEGHVYKSILKR
jgi:hypothetical protein